VRVPPLTCRPSPASPDPGACGALAEGLRDRKKRLLRQAISDVATRLFMDRGFEAVTLAEIAEAADVSVKTIFNHFGSKEELFFDRAGELEASVVTAITARGAGTTVLQALEALLVDNRVPFAGEGWEGAQDAERAEGFRRFLETQRRSPALRARRLTLGEEMAGALAPVLAAELRRDRDDPALRVLVAMLVAVLHLRNDVLTAAVLAQVPSEQVRREVTAVVRAAFTRLTAAFGDLDLAR
jgi:AcrR family transcriptional regulator